MSFEVFEKLEAKVQQAIDTITYGKIACALCWAKWKRSDSSRQAATKRAPAAPFFMTENHSMSSGSSERMMPVLSAYR